MSDPSSAEIPADDPERQLVVARPDEDGSLPHISLAGDTYTILLTGEDTAGRYTLIDMHVPAGGGPPPHRHDFEEMFTVLDGELDITFRGEHLVAKAGETVNVPANAPHGFHNGSDEAVRLLCMCSPSGQEQFFMEVGVEVDSRTSPPPELGDDAVGEMMAKAAELAPRYRTDLMLP
jgi:quercetin dioxygenase-like cupin family protein